MKLIQWDNYECILFAIAFYGVIGKTYLHLLMSDGSELFQEHGSDASWQIFRKQYIIIKHNNPTELECHNKEKFKIYF